MFFSITKDILDNFPCHIDFGFEYLNLDEGWHYTKIGNVQIAYKGYLDDGRLEDHLGEIVEQDTPKFMGTNHGSICSHFRRSTSRHVA